MNVGGKVVNCATIFVTVRKLFWDCCKIQSWFDICDGRVSSALFSSVL